MKRQSCLVLVAALVVACSDTPERVIFEAESPEFEAAAEEYRAIWAKDGDRIVEVLERATGLSFEEQPVMTIVYEGVSFSGYKKIPMRLRASYPPDTKRGTLVHELSHRLISDRVSKNFEDHPVIFLFLYDVWVELWGQEFADGQVAVESRRRGIYDYEGAWKTALALNVDERRAQWKKFISDGHTPTIAELADRYYTETLSRTPEVAYFAGVDLERHDGIEDNSSAARQAADAFVDELLGQLKNIDADSLVGTTDWITHAYLQQQLGATVAQRVCKTYLWNVNQMGGWHSGYAQIAQLQPVGTDELREQSLSRWSKFAGYVDQEIALLKEGMQLNYTAPKSVVQRVINQVDGLLALGTEKSPFYSPAARDNDESFADATREILLQQINPALQRYRDFLADRYMNAAREELSVTTNPGGLACYEASLQAYTTLNRSGKEVYELGQKTVAANKAQAIKLGKETYGAADLKEIVEIAKADPADRFSSKEELLQFSRDAVSRAEAEMPKWVGRMPAQPVEVVPFEEHEEGTGRSAHYNPAGPDRPGEYRIPLHEPENQSRGNAEATAFHETWPGHHLQVAVGQSVEGLHPITQILWFSGPGEGWARYSEALAEEMGLYQTKSGPVLRRAWPARGMVVDPGIHLFGWTREQAKAFMDESGRFPTALGDDLVDRIAILPGQLTAYDSGGLEILALRKQAEEAMGEDFDIREFHDRILENGVVPLVQLRTHIEAWIAAHESGNKR